MTARNIVLSSLDYARLQDLLVAANLFAASKPAVVDVLERELARAKIVSPEEIPPYVVTMNTCVHLIDTASGEEKKYSLVYPAEANPQQGKLSILSELGVAILGYSVGDTIEWDFPDGVRRLRIDMIYFQPEACKNYDL